MQRRALDYGVVMTPRVVISLALGVGLILNSGPGVASAATVEPSYHARSVLLPAWFAGSPLDAAMPHVKTHCGDGN